MNKQEIKTALQWINGIINNFGFEQRRPTVDEVHTVKEALEHQLTNGWIPVSDRLPENKVNVLISKESGIVKVGFCNVNYNEWREDGYLIIPPIAWQPLPEPYKEVSDETNTI